MRRSGNLFEQIVTRENLRLAFYRASAGKRGHGDVRKFAANLDRRLMMMSQQLRAGTLPLGRFHQFVIRDPKERVITAPCFEERVLHHAIMQICEPVFERWLIDDTFACRVGRGRQAAVLRAAQFAGRNDWFVKLDVRKCFDSVPHDRLCELLARRFKDAQLLGLFERIIRSFRGAVGTGLPIGSLTSQHLANFYLGWCDRFVKEVLRVRAYVRYMDDLVLWHGDRKQLTDSQDRCRCFLRETLGLVLKPTTVQRSVCGLVYLGCRVLPTHVVLSRRSKRRWQHRVRLLEQATRLGLLCERELQVRLEAATAFATGAGVQSWRFRQAALQERVVGGPRGLEPGQPGRELEQHRQELPVGEPQQERPVEPEQQPGLPPGPEFR